MLRQKLFKEFFIIWLAVGLLNHWATGADLYWKWQWLDSTLHFLGGATVSIFFLWLYFFSSAFQPQKRGLKHFLLISVLAVILIGISWEIYELILGEVQISGERYAQDTTMDIIMDFLGALVACLYAYLQEHNHVYAKN